MLKFETPSLLRMTTNRVTECIGSAKLYFKLCNVHVVICILSGLFVNVIIILVVSCYEDNTWLIIEQGCGVFLAT